MWLIGVVYIVVFTLIYTAVTLAILAGLFMLSPIFAALFICSLAGWAFVGRR